MLLLLVPNDGSASKVGLEAMTGYAMIMAMREQETHLVRAIRALLSGPLIKLELSICAVSGCKTNASSSVLDAECVLWNHGSPMACT